MRRAGLLVAICAVIGCASARRGAGASDLIVNGQVVLDGGRMTAARPGVPLRR